MNDENALDDYETTLRVVRMVRGRYAPESLDDLVALLELRAAQHRAERERVQSEGRKKTSNV